MRIKALTWSVNFLSAAFINRYFLTRFFNFLLLKFSWWLQRLGINRHWGQVAFMSVEPISLCNLQCPECPTGRKELVRTNSKMSLEQFKQIIPQVKKTLLHLNLYLQGEPFLHTKLEEMIQIARQANICVSISTNGHYINSKRAQQIVASGLNRLIISLDAITPQIYMEYRINGKYDQVINSIKNIVHAKQISKSYHPLIVLQMVVFRHNEHQVNGFKELAKQLGVNQYDIKPAQIYNFEQKKHKIPQNRKFSRYKFTASNQLKIKSSLHNRCWRMWTGMVVSTDGKTAPCCFDKNLEYTYGNVFSSSVDSLWNSQNREIFKTQISSHRSQIPMCTNCTEGLKVDT